MRTPKFPMVLPGGMVARDLGKQFLREQFQTAYQTLGGQERLVHQMNKDDDQYWKGVDAMIRLQPKEAVIDTNVPVNSPEELFERLDKLEAEKRAGVGPEVIDVTPEEE